MTLRRDLYHAYELISMPVISKQSLTDVFGGRTDAYGQLMWARQIVDEVAALPSARCAVLEAKYGNYADKVAFLGEHIVQTCNLPSAVAMQLVLHWLGLPAIELRHLACQMNCSKATMTRRKQAAVMTLDALENAALQELYPKVKKLLAKAA